MIKFSDFLSENTLLDTIKKEVSNFSEDELEEFGEYLYDTYFSYEDELEDYEDDYSEQESQYEDAVSIDEINELLDMMSSEDLGLVATDIEFEDVVDEAVSRRMDSKSYNRKRKFMKKSSAQMRKEKAYRMAYNRKNKLKAKRYYKQNKGKIKSYQKDYKAKVKAGRHRKKLRKKA